MTDCSERDRENDQVVITEAGGVLVLRINRPESLNTVNQHVATTIAASIQAAEQEGKIKAILITGTGEKAFSAGADLKALSRGERPWPTGDLKHYGFGGCTENLPNIPIVVAANGLAVGGGLEMSLAADVLIADPRATFALPEVKRALVAGGGGAIRLPRQLPPKVAQWMLLTGKPIDAARAFDLGLVSLLSEEGKSFALALETCKAIAENAPLAVRGTLDIYRSPGRGIPHSEKEAWTVSQEVVDRMEMSQDFQEGFKAFIDKRKPEWKGK